MEQNHDKRSVFTDALHTLGTIITENEKRDAIHLAVEPVVAAETLSPGQRIGLNAKGEATSQAKTIGIVDPFLLRDVFQGERFWLVVLPRTITSLRHVWEHPDVPDAEALRTREAVIDKLLNGGSIQWLREYADELRVSYKDLMSHAKDYVEHGEFWNEGSKFDGEYLKEDFWEHYQRATGERIPKNKQDSFFSCSC